MSGKRPNTTWRDLGNKGEGRTIGRPPSEKPPPETNNSPDSDNTRFSPDETHRVQDTKLQALNKKCYEFLSVINDNLQDFPINESDVKKKIDEKFDDGKPCGGRVILQPRGFFVVAAGGFGFQQLLTSEQQEFLEKHNFDTDDIDYKIFYDDRNTKFQVDRYERRNEVLTEVSDVKDGLLHKFEKFRTMVHTTCIAAGILEEEGSKLVNLPNGCMFVSKVVDVSIGLLTGYPGMRFAVDSWEENGRQGEFQDDFVKSEVVSMFLLCVMLLFIQVPAGDSSKTVVRGNNFKRLPKFQKITLRVMLLLGMEISEDALTLLTLQPVQYEEEHSARGVTKKRTCLRYPQMEVLARQVVEALLESTDPNIQRYLQKTYKVYNVDKSVFEKPGDRFVSRGYDTRMKKNEVTGGGDDNATLEGECLGYSIPIDDFTRVQLAYDENTNQLDLADETIITQSGGSVGSTGGFVTMIACMASLIFATVIGSVRR